MNITIDLKRRRHFNYMVEINVTLLDLKDCIFQPIHQLTPGVLEPIEKVLGLRGRELNAFACENGLRAWHSLRD